MTSQSGDMLVWLTIFGAAGVTYSLRIGGLLLAERLPKTGRFKRFMEALPGTILLSLIVPAALAAGPIGWLATLCTALCSLKTGCCRPLVWLLITPKNSTMVGKYESAGAGAHRSFPE